MTRRTYAQYCGLAKALDVVGERWTLLIVRNLLLGPLRYSGLLNGLPGITTNLLAKRLREMTEQGILERSTGDGGGLVYRLTPEGRALEPAIHALGAWGFRRMGLPEPDDRRDLEWFLVSLRRRYRRGATLSAELRVEDTPYRIVLTPDSVETGRGSPADVDVRLRGEGMRLARLFLTGWPEDGLPDGLEVEGPTDRARELVESFERGDTGAVHAC